MPVGVVLVNGGVGVNGGGDVVVVDDVLAKNDVAETGWALFGGLNTNKTAGIFSFKFGNGSCLACVGITIICSNVCGCLWSVI